MKKIFKVLLAFTLAITLVACGSSSDESGEVLKVGSGADPVSLDPHAVNDQASSRVRTNIYESLVEQTADLEIKPLLAKEWENDGKEWTFKLEEGVKFHNGEEMMASDVVFSLERAQESTEVGHLVESIASVEAVDDYTVKITTAEVDLGLLPALAHTTIAVLSEKAVTEQGDDYGSGNDGNDPIGTAPFKFEEFQKGKHTKLVKFDDYWNEDKAAKVSGVTFYPYPENSTRLLALQGGDIDIAYDVDNADFATVESDDSLKYEKDYDLSYAYAGFNMENEKFQDVRVRKAINLGINYDEIVDAKTILNGMAQHANTPLSLKANGYNADIPAYEYDPEEAKKLLAEAGVSDLSFTILTNENPLRVQIATAIQAQLKEIGVTVTVEQMEWGAYLEATAKGDHEVFILGWTAVTGDPNYGLSPLFHSDNIGSAGNRTFYSNPELDAVLDAAAISDNEEERFELYDEAQQIIMDDYVHIPFHYSERITAMSTNVEGFEIHPSGSPKLNGVELK
ncbi:MAG: ABC transporter substrate-binding protein [Bacilli bacterium]